MILVSAQGLGRQFTGDPIFSELSFEIRAGERIGLVGPNGAGKTTLMQILAGADQADYGKLFVRPGIRLSFLRQEIDFDPAQTLIEVARSGLASLIDLQHVLEEAAQEMAEAEDDLDRQRAEPPAMTRSTVELSTRTPTRSNIASKKCSPGWGSPKPISNARPRPSRADSNRG